MRLHGGVWLSLPLLPAGYACVCAFGDQWRPETHLFSDDVCGPCGNIKTFLVPW